jgi:predicted deacylase
MGTITVCNRTIKSGTRETITLPITKDLGVKLEMTAHILAGRQEGPTMLLVSMLHGEEWLYILAFKKILEIVDLESLKGQLIIIPVANPSALNTGTRCTQDNSDEPDANRAFGGIHKWISNQVANLLDESFISIADYMMDFHGGAFGRTMADIGYGSDIGTDEFVSTCRRMSQAYRFPIIHKMKMNKGAMSGRNSVGRAVTKYNIPATIPELGGIGWGNAVEAEWVRKNVEGILNVMKFAGMLEGEPKYLERYLMVGDYWRIYPANGGYFETLIDLDRQFTRIEKNELMGRIYDPATFELLEELRCPGEGTLFYTSRSKLVRPGSWTFGVADMSVSSWEVT